MEMKGLVASVAGEDEGVNFGGELDRGGVSRSAGRSSLGAVVQQRSSATASAWRSRVSARSATVKSIVVR